MLAKPTDTRATTEPDSAHQNVPIDLRMELHGRLKSLFLANLDAVGSLPDIVSKSIIELLTNNELTSEGVLEALMRIEDVGSEESSD